MEKFIDKANLFSKSYAEYKILLVLIFTPKIDRYRAELDCNA
jgi:hypothetical protein